MISFRRFVVGVVALSTLLVSAVGCSSSVAKPSVGALRARLAGDAALGPAVRLVPERSVASVWECAAGRLRTDARARDLTEYVAKRRSFAAIRPEGGKRAPAQSLQDCLRKALIGH
jgi:hypothetical protein